MSANLIKEAKKLHAGKGGRLEDQELEFLAKEITKLGFKLGFARAYAAGPSMIEKLVRDLEQRDNQIREIQKIIDKK